MSPGGRRVELEFSSERLLLEIKNLVLSQRLIPVEGYEFPQEKVADFWKDVFCEKGIKVFGSEEVPGDVKVMQVDFVLPDEPPEWLIGVEE